MSKSQGPSQPRLAPAEPVAPEAHATSLSCDRLIGTNSTRHKDQVHQSSCVNTICSGQSCPATNFCHGYQATSGGGFSTTTTFDDTRYWLNRSWFSWYTNRRKGRRKQLGSTGPTSTAALRKPPPFWTLAGHHMDTVLVFILFLSTLNLSW